MSVRTHKAGIGIFFLINLVECKRMCIFAALRITKIINMRKLLLSLFGLLAVVCSKAQDMKVVDFRLLENDLTANTRGTEKMDQNGERAALIKIVTPERGFTFDGGSLGIVASEEHTGEIWLYVPRRAQKLIVKHDAFPSPSVAVVPTRC